MDEHTPPPRWTRLDWKLVALLALLAGGIRCWQLTHTEVAARDSIGFIRLAWQLRQAELTEWPAVLKHSEQHPLYPVWLLTVSHVVEPFYHGPAADLFRLSAQLASTIAAILLVIPLFALGRELFDRRVGFLLALLIQCLPVSGRILADGLTEATFLLFATSGLFWGVVALRQPGRPLAFALTGLCGGLAYLTRPEGAVIVAATGIVLLAGQAVRAWRRSWRDCVVSGAALSAAALLLAMPFIACTGKLTVKPTADRVRNDLVDARPSATCGPLFAVWIVDDTKPPSERFWWGFYALGTQIGKGTFYVGWALALLGLWWSRERFRSHPGLWMMALVCLGIGYALWRVAVVVGYLSDRHALLIVVCLMPWALAALLHLGKRMALPAVALPLAFVLSGLPKTLAPLHGERSGLREAGLWLAEHTHSTDPVVDPLCWSHYYAGRVFLEHTDNPVPPGHRTRKYVVVEEAGNEHLRLKTYQEARALATTGTEVYHWTGKRGTKHAEVHIYEVLLPSVVKSSLTPAGRRAGKAGT